MIPVRSLDSAGEILRHFPPGADEILLQAGVGRVHARNTGRARSTGDVVLNCEDDIFVDGDLTYFHRAPLEETWWIPRHFETTVLDPYTQRVCMLMNALAGFRNHAASLAWFQPVRRWALDEIGGYDESVIHDDVILAKTLFRRFGPPAVAPISVVILRRLSTFQEVCALYAKRRPPTDGPYRIFRPRSATSARPGSALPTPAP